MSFKPFLKWAGGKRWLAERADFTIPPFPGKYIEPFLGGGAIYFSVLPEKSLLSDVNPKLIEVYSAIRDYPNEIKSLMDAHQELHSRDHYYDIRSRKFDKRLDRAAQFLYLNRACWNGLYRENLRGEFNVPIGSKTLVSLPSDDFSGISKALAGAELKCCDFEETISQAVAGDFLFVDPPYTTAHNFNGFVKYNQNIFRWEDQIRLRNCIASAAERGVIVIVTNADHPSVREIYKDIGKKDSIERASVISGKLSGRQSTSELIIRCNI